MNLVVNNHNVFVIVFVTFLTSLLLVPIVKKTALHIGVMDEPNERKIHKVAMPRFGDLAIYIAFLLGYILYGETTTQMISILIGSFLLIIVGIFDDINSVPAKWMFLIQLLTGAVVVIYGKLGFSKLTILGLTINFEPVLGDIVSIIFIATNTNTVNLIDGLDGLASGISSIYFLTIVIITIILNRLWGLDMILSLIMLGSTLRFLFHNFPPAKIFMGNIRSLFLGFIVSVIALLGYKVTTFTSFIIPIIVLAIPLFDTIFAILRRLLKGQSIAVADKESSNNYICYISDIVIIYYSKNRYIV